MIRSILFSFVLYGFSCFAPIASSAQTADLDRTIESYYHQKGQQSLSLGGAIASNPTQFNFSLINGGTGSGNPSPAIELNYEYGITRQFGIGAFVSYYRVDAQQDLSLDDIFGSDLLDDPVCLAECLLGLPIGGCDCQTGSIKERTNVFTLAGKLTYHFQMLDKLDTYTAFTAGYSFNRRKTITEDVAQGILNEIGLETEVPTIIYYAAGGAKYYFKENWAAYGEVGFSNVHLIRLGITKRW